MSARLKEADLEADLEQESSLVIVVKCCAVGSRTLQRVDFVDSM